MEIKRDYYLKKLIEAKNDGLIKTVTGLRRCGKSYLLNTIFYNYLIEEGVKEDHIIKVALDDTDNEELLNPKNLSKYVKEKIIDKDTYYVILDEIQLVENFEDNLSVKCVLSYNCTKDGAGKEWQNRPFTTNVTRSFLLLPEQPSKPKITDSRIAIFPTENGESRIFPCKLYGFLV